MKFKSVLKTVLIGISYYSFKKIIDNLAEPYRKIAIFSSRLCLFLLLFLSIYAFLCGRIYAITHAVSVPLLITNIFLGICFFISFVVSFLLTAVCEEIYRKLSELEKQAVEKISAVKESVQEPFEKVKESILLTKIGIEKTLTLAGTTSKYLYDTSLKLTSVGMDSLLRGFKKIRTSKAKTDQSNHSFTDMDKDSF